MDTFKPKGAASERAASTGNLSISDALREARLARGLELREISEQTHVRVDYLEALEEGRFERLPESIYARNFLKLFANAVGLDATALAERFGREVSGMSAPPNTLNAEPDERVGRSEERTAWASWLPAILLVLAVLALTLWLFNRFLFNPPVLEPAPESAVTNDILADDTSVLPPANTASEAATADAASDAAPINATPTDAAATLPEDASAAVASTLTPAPSEVLVTLTTTPPGAQVSIDNYALPGTTPIADAPISSGEGRTVNITLEGYAPLVETVDLTEDTTLAFTLQTEAELAALETASAEDGTDSSLSTLEDDTASVATQGLVLTVNEATWVEVYQGAARGAGERLVYETVQPGSTFTFELPIYIHVGNANGVNVTLDGQDLGSLGSTGEVTGRAFTQ